MKSSVWLRIVVVIFLGGLLILLALEIIQRGKQSPGIATNDTRVTKKEERPEVGYLAPDFSLPGLGGKTLRLSDFRGKKAVFLNFWATWCGPCRAEMPSMQSLYEEFRSKDFEMLAVSVDRYGSDKPVQNFVEERQFTFPVLLDRDGGTQTRYGVYGIPTTFLVDKSGVIVKKEVGARDWFTPEVKAEIERLITGKTASE